MYYGTHEIKKVYVNGHQGKKLYLGDKLLWDDIVRYAISCTLDGVTSDAPSIAIGGESLSVTLTPASGKQICPWTIKVMMGETDVTSSAYDSSTNTITIANVTDNVSITASAVTMDSAYKPVEYISVASKASGNALDTGYKPSSNTKLVMDVELNNGNANMLYGNHYTNSTTTPHYFFMYQVTSTSNYVIGFGTYNSGTISTSAGRIKRGARITFTCDKGLLNYPNASGGTRNINYGDDGGTFEESSTTLKIFGYSTTSSTGTATGKIYRVSLYENDVLKKDLIPCVKVEDGIAGLYDIVNATYIKATNYTAAS